MFELMPASETIVVIFLVFLLAGTVKGIVGLGLPTICLGLLTVTLDLSSAMILLLVPSLTTNLWQALVGGNFIKLIRRLWSFFLFASIFIILGALFATNFPTDTLSILLGALLVLYGTSSLLGLQLNLSKQKQRWCGPVFGAINGIFTGMAGSFVVPGVLYLQAIGLRRDALVQAMGILFCLSTLGLGISIWAISIESPGKKNETLYGTELIILSCVALIPTMVGMIIGQKIRTHLSESLFRRFLFMALLILGLYIIAKTIIA
ncbi:sulfite exporter TauE/SafE family protein [Kiloniella majae]|uniref:sulfite exporter TauE/SafE family protein n=1 Tax=Kiloniella majae TaxID=1938558 RepID=UPI0018E97D66|nr:sulfite exporter TauE/SafE family protein [Kiloniella majae]